jgi:hypothetical protein
VLAEETKPDTQGLLAATAILAGSIAQSRIDDDEIICSVDVSDSIRAEDPWWRDVNSR